MSIVLFPYGYIPDSERGRPLDSADIFIGKPGLDPEVVGNQVQVFEIQEDGTNVPITQPIKTGVGGVPITSGSPAVISVNETQFSIKINDKLGAQKYFQKFVSGFVDFSNVRLAAGIFDSLTGDPGNDALSAGGDIGDRVQTYEYNSGSGVGGAEYEIVSTNPGSPLVNPLKSDGNFLKLIFEGSVPVTQAGAVPGDNTSDIYLSWVDMTGAGITSADLVGLDFFQLTAGVLSIDIVTSAPNAKITCLNNVLLVVSTDDFVIGDNIAIDFDGGQIETWLSILDGAARPKIGAVTFQNSFSPTFTNFIQVGAYGVTDFIFDGVAAQNVDVQKSGSPGDVNGSMRLILMSGPVSGNPMSHGSIRNIWCNEFGNDEDSDLIQIFNLTEARPYDIDIYSIRAHNVGKRAVKVQANGCRVWDVTCWNDRIEDQFVAVGHLRDDGEIWDIKIFGNSTYCVELFGSTEARGLYFNSTSSSANAVVTCAGGSPVLSQLNGKGLLKNAVLVRPTISPIGLMSVTDVTGEYTQQVILAGMDTTGSGNNFDHLVLKDIGGTSSTPSLNLVVCSAFGAERIGRVDMNDYTSEFSGAPPITAISIQADSIYLNDISDKTATGSVISLTNASLVRVHGANTTSGNRLISILDCSNTSFVNCEGGSSEVIRIDGGDSHIMNGNITTIGGSSNSQLNAPTNVQDVNPIVRT